MNIGVFLKIMYVVLAVVAVASVVNCVLVIKKIKDKNLGIIKGVFRIFSLICACGIAVFAIFVMKGEMTKQGDAVLAVHPYGISEITYGDVFNEYCWNMEWSMMHWNSSESDTTIIQMDGTCVYQDREQNIVMQFNIGKREFFEFEEEPYFYINFIALDDVDSISEEEMEDILYSMFAQYIEEKGLSISIPESKKSALLYSENAPWYDDTEIETFNEDTEEEIIEDTEEEATDLITEEEQSTSEEIDNTVEQAVIDPLELAGLYQGTCEGASLDISIYSSPEDGSIGSAYLAVASRDAFISYTAGGEVRKMGIDNTYQIENEFGDIIVLKFYYSGDTLYCDVPLNGDDVDTYYMVEHYQS